LGLRPGSPVLIVHVDRFNKKMPAEGGRKCTCGCRASVAAGKKYPDFGNVFRLLDGRWLEVVELGEDELLELWIAARHMNVECRPALTQKYL
jgi:hypothetical protein